MSKFSVLIEHFKQYFDFCGATELKLQKMLRNGTRFPIQLHRKNQNTA